MASDQLNEVGKYLKTTRDIANRAIKKNRPYRPSVERIRDIFDTEVPFTMEFNISKNQKNIKLDLEFNKPPPLKQCLSGTDCPRMYCDLFDNLEAGEHELQLSYAVKSQGITAVFVNSIMLDSSNWALLDIGIFESTPGSILVTNLTSTVNTVVVCYQSPCSLLYRGTAYAALISGDGTSGASIGDNPPSGWSAEPTYGPLTPIDGTYTIEINSDMIVRVSGRMDYSIVPSNGNVILTYGFIVNGVQSYLECSTITGGLYFANGAVSFDYGDIEVHEGDSLSAIFSFSSTYCGSGATPGAGGFAALPTNSGRYFRVGRGITYLLSETWVGPHYNGSAWVVD